MLKKIAGLILLILSVSFLSSFITSLDFSKTGFEGLIGEGTQHSERQNQNYQNQNYQVYQETIPNQSIVFGEIPTTGESGSDGGGAGESKAGGGKGGGGGAAFSQFSNMNSPFNPPNIPLFFVEGLDNTTNYLRLYTSSRYVNGVWVPDELSCSQQSIPVFSKKFKVKPIVALTEYLPVSKETKGVTFKSNSKVGCYDSDKGVFSVKSVREAYFGYSTAKKIKPTAIDGRIQPYDDPEIRELAEKITANATGDYEKVKAIESFLKKNYVNYYVNNANIKDFLFRTRIGTAREFASAFVLLTQSLGYPSRVVFGYLADPVPYNQTIFASDGYVWAEVKFAEGWVEFDPTPEGTGINTTTEITHVDSKLIAGENFTVKGRVEDINGNPVSGYVEIFLKKNKESDKGLLVGIARVNGTFSAKLRVPEITGRYNVVAHYTGSLYHHESWSDPEVEIYCRPEINVTLPDRVAKNFTLKGRMVTVMDKPYTGYIELCIDNSCKDVKVVKGYFEERVSLVEGEHEIKLLFPGKGFLLPSSYAKKVQAGDVVILLNESVREGENVTGRILFNGKPVNTTLLVDGKEVKAVNGNFSVNLPLKLGKNELDFKAVDFLYSEKRIVFSKRNVEIETQRYGNELRVIVKDGEGNPADGFVTLNGVRKELKGGMAVFDIPDEGGIIVYSGSERYFPAVKELNFSFPIFILIPALLAGAGAIIYYLYRILWKEEEIRIMVEKEHPELPDVWDAGEKIRIYLEEPAFVGVEGDGGGEFSGYEGVYGVSGVGGENSDTEKLFTDSLELSFDSYGVKKIVAERQEGRKKKKGTLEIKIMPYSDGIAEIVRKLEDVARKKFSNVESMTGREIMERLGIKAPVLLNYFEQGKYGKRNYSRKEFLEAFEDYLRVMKGENF